MLNLKELLTFLPPSLKGLFEKRAHIEAASFVQTRTKFRHSLPRHGRNGTKSTLFASEFVTTRQARQRQGIPTSTQHKLAGTPESITRAHHTCQQTVTGFHERVPGWLLIWLN